MGTRIFDLQLCSISLTWCLLAPPTHTTSLSLPPLSPACLFSPFPYLSFLTVDSFCLVNAAPFPVSLPLCVKRMQFLSLPQWSLAWSAPESTWCGATGGATPPKAWTLTTLCTARPPARARRTRYTSAEPTPWVTTRITIHTRKASMWELWGPGRAPARSSSPCHLAAACPTPEPTGTPNSRCFPRRSEDAQGHHRWRELNSVQATYHQVFLAAIWFFFVPIIAELCNDSFCAGLFFWYPQRIYFRSIIVMFPDLDWGGWGQTRWSLRSELGVLQLSNRACGGFFSDLVLLIWALCYPRWTAALRESSLLKQKSCVYGTICTDLCLNHAEMSSL